MDKNNIIELTNMEFFSHHGCFSEEQLIGNKFIVNLSVKYDLGKASASDELSDTINYQELYNIVKEQMGITSKLLEHVAGRILNAIKTKYPMIESATVSIDKLNPPLGGQVGSSRVVMSY